LKPSGPSGPFFLDDMDFSEQVQAARARDAKHGRDAIAAPR
jgi:hypothetical protein